MTSSIFDNNICVINKMVINNRLFNDRQHIHHNSVSDKSRGSSDIIINTIAATLTIVGFNDYENGTEIETSDGELTLEEFRAGMKETTRLGDDDIDRIFKELDQDDNCIITVDELLVSSAFAALVAVDERLFDAFSEMDKDGDGFIEVKELKQAIKQLKF